MNKCYLLFFCMLFYSSSISCQHDNPLKPSQIGFSFNWGMKQYDFSAFNQEIAQYDFIDLEPECMIARLDAHLGSPTFMSNIYVSSFVNLLDNYANQRYINFYGYSIGMRVMRKLYAVRSFRSRYYIGANASFLNLSFVDGTSSGVKAQIINQLIGNNAITHLTPSSLNRNLEGGINLELLPKWFIKNKPHRSEFINLLLDIGYNFSLDRERNWVIRGVRTPNRISGIPRLNTNHFYVLLGTRFMFDAIFKKEKSS